MRLITAARRASRGSLASRFSRGDVVALFPVGTVAAVAVEASLFPRGDITESLEPDARPPVHAVGEALDS